MLLVLRASFVVGSPLAVATKIDQDIAGSLQLNTEAVTCLCPLLLVLQCSAFAGSLTTSMKRTYLAPLGLVCVTVVAGENVAVVAALHVAVGMCYSTGIGTDAEA